jgi:hypothetical protein
MRQRITLMLMMTMAASMAAPLMGQNEPNRARPADPNSNKQLNEATVSSPWLWDAQLVMNAYVNAMVKAYNLTDKQAEYTRELMNQRVKQFLKDYEKDARTLMGEWFEYKAKQELPSPQAAKDFARRAQPLLPILRQEIIEGNMQWRRILNEDQLKKHDKDLEALNATFDNFDKVMTRWSNGDIRPTDVGLPQRNKPFLITKAEDMMGSYVKAFIVRYNLDEGQKRTAESILREARQEVSRYRDSHKDEFSEIDAKLKDLIASNPQGDDEVKRAKEEGRKLTERKAELEKPLNEELFARFKERLETIPTADQRAADEARQKSLNERLTQIRKRAATMPATTRPATTQPAGDTPKAAND